MGAFLDKPKTEKHVDVGEGNEMRYGLSSMQGWRVEMEDAHCTVPNIPHDQLSSWAYYAVFDGHAGGKVSICCSEQLLSTILETEDFKKISPDMSPDMEAMAVCKGVREGFLTLDAQMRDSLQKGLGMDRSGSTAVCVLVSPHHFYFINCGDSRALLVRENRVYFATQDHKPSNPLERERIQNAGGSVLIQRVNGSLAVSRSLGDFEYKNTETKSATEQQVSPEPEIEVIPREADQDQLIVLACDGVWDVMTNEEVAQFALNRIRVHENLSSIATEVIDTCLYKGSKDNMSFVIVALPAAPKPHPDAIQEDKQVNQVIEQKIKNYIDQSPVYNVASIIDQLNNENLIGLPPGGGLASKRPLIDQVFQKLTVDYAIGDNQDDEDHIFSDSRHA